MASVRQRQIKHVLGRASTHGTTHSRARTREASQRDSKLVGEPAPCTHGYDVWKVHDIVPLLCTSSSKVGAKRERLNGHVRHSLTSCLSHFEADGGEKTDGEKTRRDF
eukprot:6182188-Pleurochrysis_carterae.AAC.1